MYVVFYTYVISCVKMGLTFRYFRTYRIVLGIYISNCNLYNFKPHVMLLSIRVVCLVTLSRTSLEKKNSKKFDVFCFGLEKNIRDWWSSGSRWHIDNKILSAPLSFERRHNLFFLFWCLYNIVIAKKIMLNILILYKKISLSLFDRKSFFSISRLYYTL